MALARNMSVTEDRPQPNHPGLSANTVEPSRALPKRWCGCSCGDPTNTSTAKRANTVAVAARATGSRAAHSLTPNNRKLRATIQ